MRQINVLKLKKQCVLWIFRNFSIHYKELLTMIYSKIGKLNGGRVNFNL